MPNKVNKNELIKVSPNSKIMKQYKASLNNLNDIQWQASIGLMLGDASLQTQNKGKTYRLKFEWSNKILVYIQHVHKLFDEWVISEPHKKERISPKNNLVINWGFQTISHEAFNKLASLFINNGVKSISNNLIIDHLTGIGLAYWFMDDGGKLDYNLKSKNKSIVLNTQSFTSEEVEMMCDQLNIKFNLECETRYNKSKKIIVIKNYDVFMDLAGPHIIDSMRYKLPHN